MRPALLALLALWPSFAFPQATRVQPGIDVLLSDRGGPLAGKRVALITHPAGVTSTLESTVDALAGIKGIMLVALMAPEHGVRGAALAGQSVSAERDPKTGLPVFSLFRDSVTVAANRPTQEMLAGADVLVYDVQDIGSRSYTYITTMALAMEAAADAGILFVVLDRPDPLGGNRIEGNIPPEGSTRTWVSYLPIPSVYGMTPGELARMINGEGWLAGGKRCRLKVVPLNGWKRSMIFAETGLPWVPTSPHIPHADTALFYAATGIIGELGTINEGVGYPAPFEFLGAPWIDAERFAGRMNALRLPGLVFRPLSYRPFYGTYGRAMCQGVQIHLTDPRRAPLTAIQFYALEALRTLHPSHSVFGASSDGIRGFDQVMGSSETRDWMEAGKPYADLEARWEKEDAAFREHRRKYLLYR